MKAKIQHLKWYKYSQPVFLESQELRLCPRFSNNFSVTDFKYTIEPEPSSVSFIFDAEGNSVIKAWFNQKTDFFNVEVCWTGENSNYNPYDFIIKTDCTNLPAKNDAVSDNILKVYKHIPKESSIVKNFSDYLAKKSNYLLLSFLTELTGEIYHNFLYEKRDEGEAYPPDYTLKYKVGACRDLAVLFMEICRYQGIAARYVSGYKIHDKVEENTDLHAWVEVYIEGAGWKAFDPSAGLAVNDEYFPLASSYSPLLTMPVIGTFRSNSATSSFETFINTEII